MSGFRTDAGSIVGMSKPTDDELRRRFFYHRPTTNTLPRFDAVNEATFALAKLLRDTCPEGRNLSLALTHLEDVRMRANAAIACDTPDGERGDPLS